MTSYRAALVNYVMLAYRHRDRFDNRFCSLGRRKDMGKAREVIWLTPWRLIGALYLDGGYEDARKFVNTVVLEHRGSTEGRVIQRSEKRFAGKNPGAEKDHAYL